MKTITYFLIVFGMLATVEVQAQKAMDQFEIQVDGLGCPFCAYGLEKKFKEFKGIKKVAIDIETGDFSFQYPAEDALSLEAVEKQVEKAGYTPVTTRILRADGTEETSGSGAVAMAGDAELKEAMVKVAGNCEMCQARIEKAARSVSGVSEASWDKESKILTLQFDAAKTATEAVEKAVAAAGHDTANHAAHKDDYGDLPACCKYERIHNQ